MTYEIDPQEVEAVAKVIYEQWLRRWWQPRSWEKNIHKGRCRLIVYLALATALKFRSKKEEMNA